MALAFFVLVVVVAVSFYFGHKVFMRRLAEEAQRQDAARTGDRLSRI